MVWEDPGLFVESGRVHRGSRRVKKVLEGPGSRILDSQKLLGRSGSVRTSLGWFRKFQDV